MESASDVVIEVPQRLLDLADALDSVSKSAHQTLARRCKTSSREFDPIEDTLKHMRVTVDTLGRLQARVSSLMADVVTNESAGAVEVGRTAGRLEQVLSELLDGYRDAKTSYAEGDANKARLLTMAVYRHHIVAICRWMDAMVMSIRDPSSVCMTRSVATSANEVIATVVLKMSTPPELEQLQSLFQDHLRCKYPTPLEVNQSLEPLGRENGLLRTIGALVFGFGVANSTFGQRQE